MDEDWRLLSAYAERRDDEAFRELVARHGSVVQGVARRIAGPAHADEVAQTVFVLLARKARGLGTKTNLAGWLYNTARYTALESARRQRRELKLQQELSSMANESTEADSVWVQLAPVLDAALNKLRSADREAIILRFLQGRSFAEVAAAMNSSEAAAKMRVGRALEKLRGNLAGQGMSISATALGVAISAHGAPAASASLASAALSHSINPALPTLAKIILKMLLMKKFKMAAAVAAALLLTGAITYPFVRPAPVLGTFAPMNGEWVGQMEVNANGSKTKNPVQLLVKTSPDGRRCDIEMRVGDPTRNLQMFHFSHEIDATGRQIATTDDPRVNLLNGAGKVIAAKAGSNWKAAVRTEYRNGYTECEWRVNGDQMTINRHDSVGFLFLHRSHQYSTLDLKRKSEAG